MTRVICALVAVVMSFAALARAENPWVVYEGGDGPGKGKHVVLLSGDEEYRSEESMPMLAKILSQRHGFKCTVLYAVDPDGTINPDNARSLAGAEALDSADAIVMCVRFRAWPDDQMKHFVDAYRRGVPIVALRTSTHAFKYDGGTHADFNTFGKRVLGEQWVSHWGKHKVEATKGIVEEANAADAVLRGVTDVFGNSDVYEAYPPADAKILLRGQVLKGMTHADAPADYAKKRASDQEEQPVNNPMMPVAWTRLWKNEAGKENRILCTTMGAATDLESEGLRRLVVNGVYWGLGIDVPAKADVTYVGPYTPTMYGFKGYVKGVRPADHAIKKAAGALKLQQGEHVAIIGNALADRMQHHGYLETLVHAKFPTHQLVFRNLAFAGDEINWRHRSENFGSPDDWLTKVKADVIFAFFGFNESFKGEAGLPAFRAELDKWLKETAGKKYNGKGEPRVVLFSPIAAERNQDRNYPDPAAINANVEKYAAVMREVAAANGVLFVDLLTPSKELYARGGGTMTLNGRYLTDEAERLLAPAMFQGIFSDSAPAGDLETLRNAVNQKNAQWHARYRTVDGYNVYGGRSKLSFPSGEPGKEIDNFHVMQEEMSQRDVLTANRDPLVWAVAQDKAYTVDDSNLPPVTVVPTNRPGENEDKSHQFLSGQAAIAKMKLHPGTKVNLFASEEKFPELVNPVQMAWDTRGRLWVSAWRNYPERTPTSKVGDSLLVLEDVDGDGSADKCTHFLDDLNCPTGFQFYKDGVLVMQAPDLWFVRDRDGDGVADSKERILMGMDSADSHHTANSLVLEPGGAVYLSDGVFHRTQVESASGVVRNNDGAIYRFEPRTGKFETYVAYSFANPHGRVFDYWGNDLITDATGNNTYYGPAFSGRLSYPHKHPRMEEYWKRPSRPSPGTGIMTSKHFPDEFWGNFLNLNVISFQGIYRVKSVEDGSGIKGEKQEDVVSSADPNFRPTAVNVGPDGAVYFADWHNPIIGHMQHHIRDPNRDHQHGRIYRMTYEGRELSKMPKIEGEPIEALLELLKSPENQVREWAKLELGRRDSAEVVAATKKWAQKLDKSDPAIEHHATEALWVHQWHNVVDRQLLDRVLNSPDPRARAQGVRVLCYWRDRIPEALDLLRERAADENPRVRLEVVRATSFFDSPDAVQVALGVLKHPTDYYIDYTLGETMRQLEPYWRESIAKMAGSEDAVGLEYLVRSLSSADLLKLPPVEPVLRSILGKADVTDPQRHQSLKSLSELWKVDRTQALLRVLEATRDGNARGNVARLLPQMTRSELKAARSRVHALAKEDKRPNVRYYAWAAISQADESWDAAFAEASPLEIVSAVPLVFDPSVRSDAYEKVLALATAPQSDRAVRRVAIRALASIPAKGKASFAALTKLIESGTEVPTAAGALKALPASAIDRPRVGDVVDGLVKWAAKQSEDKRTSEDYLSVVQLAEQLVTSLPADRAAGVVKELKSLRVAAFVVRAVPEQMRYDTARLVVEAGKPFEITFENPDLMPHNLVIVKPGARERIGTDAMKLKADQPDSMGRPFVPSDPAVLAATRLLENGQHHILRLTAPNAEGDYEYVCTYPDHWRVMFGKLVVTDDIDEYLRTHPDPAAPATADKVKHVHQ